MPSLRRLIRIVLITAAGFYVAACAALFTFQRSLIYYPQPASTTAGITPLTFRVGPETVAVATHPSSGSEAILYFGGNAEDVSRDMADFAATFPNDAIYLLDYPGYGGSSGKPTERKIIADAEVLFDRVHLLHPDIILIGRSLGTGVAVHIAAERPIKRLVLVTPYDSLIDPAAAQYPLFPVRLLALDTFDSGHYAPQVTAPTHIIAAQNDEIIPPSSTQRLRSRFKPGLVSYTLVPNAGHNTISETAGYWNLLAAQ